MISKEAHRKAVQYDAQNGDPRKGYMGEMSVGVTETGECSGALDNSVKGKYLSVRTLKYRIIAGEKIYY